MKRIFTEEEFNKIKNYVISNSINPNADRCCLFSNADVELAMCFNEIDLAITICEGSFKFTMKHENLFDYLIELCSFSEGLNEIQQKRLNFYNESVEQNSICCVDA